MTDADCTPGREPCSVAASFASSYRWGATRQNVSRLAAIRRG